MSILLSGVYLIRCTANSWVYVGSTKDFARRWFKEHLPELRKGVHPNPRLQQDWNCYGESSFVFEPIIHCRPIRKELRWHEQLALDAHWNYGCYNDNPIAAVPPVIRWRTPEWNANVAAALTGVPLSDDHKAALRSGWGKRKAKGLLRTKKSYELQGDKTKGRKQSAEWVEKRTAKLRGRTLSESQKRQISNTLKGRPASSGTVANLREIAALRTPARRAWLGRKGAASRWGKEFNEPCPD